MRRRICWICLATAGRVIEMRLTGRRQGRLTVELEQKPKGRRRRGGVRRTSLARLGLEYRGHDGPHLLVLGPLLGLLLLSALTLAARSASARASRAAHGRSTASAAAAASSARGLELGHASGADLAWEGGRANGCQLPWAARKGIAQHARSSASSSIVVSLLLRRRESGWEGRRWIEC
jgi:hypothetical protein